MTSLKPLEEIDPALIDQAVRRVCADRQRAQDKEMAVAAHIYMSAEMQEWVDLLTRFQLEPVPPGLSMMLWAAITIGLEVGYDLGWYEAKRRKGGTP